jgi:hypothetical protein
MHMNFRNKYVGNNLNLVTRIITSGIQHILMYELHAATITFEGVNDFGMTL